MPDRHEEPLMSRGELLIGLAQWCNFIPRFCPECREKVKILATKCPHCHSKIPSLDTEQMKKARFIAVPIALAVFLPLGGYVIYLMDVF